MLAGEYTLKAGEKISGDLVFEVPAESTYFMIVYEESFSDDTTGDLFVVYTEAKK